VVFGGENFHIFYDFLIKSGAFCNKRRGKVIRFDILFTCFGIFAKKINFCEEIRRNIKRRLSQNDSILT